MQRYEVTISPAIFSYIRDSSIKLVGADGESGQISFQSSITEHSSPLFVDCPASLGKLVLIELNKEFDPAGFSFPATVEVKSPEGDVCNIPIYRCITENKVCQFRNQSAVLSLSDDRLAKERQQQELKEREALYCWDIYKEGLPHCMKAKDLHSLPSEIRFSCSRKIEMDLTALSEKAELILKGLSSNTKTWDDIEAISRVFFFRHTTMSEYVTQHWKEDAFFGSQYLNGVNPMLIRRCEALPPNFPVPSEVVLHGDYKLADEMQGGNIFMCDYKRLDGLQANTVNGKKQYLVAPLVLFQKTADGKLMPVAIQLKQTPAADNPIFYPSDSEYDWLTAKIFVRSADFHEHELNVHLLRTHLLAEVFAVSLLRNVTRAHPLFKLLIPHARFTMYINYMARQLLISEDGVFAKYVASGGEALVTFLRRSLSEMTYTSLCIEDDITERGMFDVPNYHYRDDGLKLWDIIKKYVHGVLGYFYKKDSEVQQDAELQKWMSDIFEHGFLSHANTGIPKRLNTVAEMVKFVTMVIFTCSCQHSAVNSGQYDYGGWMPNCPPTLQRPPPTTKGTTSEETILQMLPDVNATVNVMAAMWLLSNKYSGSVTLSQHSEEHFKERVPRKMVKLFKLELEKLSVEIQDRNNDLEVPYEYLDPEVIEDSVTI